MKVLSSNWTLGLMHTYLAGRESQDLFAPNNGHLIVLSGLS